MNRPYAIHARTYFCVCILSIASGALRAQNNAKPTSTQVQITNVRVGTIPIIIPSPTTELIEPGPDYRVVFETFAPVNNRLVAAFVPQDNLDGIHKGKALPLDNADSASFQLLAEARSFKRGLRIIRM